MDKQIKVVELENIEDLELLIRGDVIQRKDISSFVADWVRVAFHKVNRVGHYEFLYPGEDFITVDRVGKSIIRVEERKIVYSRDNCAVEVISQSDPGYNDLNKTLLMAGLR